MDTQQTIGRIQQMMGSYRLDDTCCLLGAERLLYDVSRARVRLIGYIPSDYMANGKNGSCLKLTKLALDEVQHEFGPEIPVVAVSGTEPRFFLSENHGLHNFLIVNHNGVNIVADPSFQYAAEMSGSEYKAFRKTDFNQLSRKDLDMKNEEAVPLALGPDGLIKLGAFISKDTLRLVIATLGYDGRLMLNYQCSTNLTTGEQTFDEPCHPLEEKVKQLVKSAAAAEIKQAEVFIPKKKRIG